MNLSLQGNKCKTEHVIWYLNCLTLQSDVNSMVGVWQGFAERFVLGLNEDSVRLEISETLWFWLKLLVFKARICRHHGYSKNRVIRG